MVRGPTTMTPQNAPKRVVSGMRPTGRLHLGHYHGAVKNWIDISEKAECFFFSADWHALTSEYKDTSKLAESQREMFADWIAAGLDPERCTLFIQSHVKQHAELFLLLGMIAPLGWLERVPTYKEQQEQLKEKDLNTYGFLGYPVLQTADVALYGADAVPVGQDQVSHLELAREIVRKFNHHYAGDKPVLVEPYPYLTDVPKILGLDGRKMSKSYGNAIELGEDPASARKRIMVAVTDPARVRRHDPGHPEVCPIYWLHRAYSPPEMVELVDRECRSAGIGCVDCKKMLLENLIPSLESHRAARAELDRDPGRIDELVQLGTRKAAAVAEQTMTAVRDAVKLA
ncbi:MAG: tryptophan--tRNA ligase [Deltaproteobacteria bacterium]